MLVLHQSGAAVNAMAMASVLAIRATRENLRNDKALLLLVRSLYPSWRGAQKSYVNVPKYSRGRA
jgi:hypothetical protein